MVSGGVEAGGPAQAGWALVTGASAGIGAVFARRLAARGYDLALVARRRDRLEALAAELAGAHGIRTRTIAADLATVDAHLPIMAECAASGIEIDTLVNNAGYSLPKTYVATSWEEQRDFTMTLVMAVCGLTHAALPGMIARGRGRIIFVGSIAGLSPGGAGHTLYPAAKSFANKFALSLDAELRRKGIKVTCVNPGSTESEFAIANKTDHLMKQMPRPFKMTAEAVVDAALAANDRGKVICVPGFVNKLSAVLMKYLPDELTTPLIRAGAEKYRVKD